MSRIGDPRTGSTESVPRHADPTRRSATGAAWVLIGIVLVLLTLALSWASGGMEMGRGWS